MIKGFFKKLGKSLLAGSAGAFVGVAIFVFYFIVAWLPLNVHTMGLAVIVLVGLILGIIFYWIVRIFRRRKN